MIDNYFRLVCFVVNLCPKPLREFFIQLAQKDAGSSYTSLDAYLARRKPDIIQLKLKKFIRDDQFDILFPGHGTTADESQWDVSLLVTLITNLFPKNIQPLEKLALIEIRQIRNTLQHVSNTANVSNSDFSSHWGRLESAVMTLAYQVFAVARQATLKTKIDAMKQNCQECLIECLRLWHEETVKQTANKIEEMSEKIKDLEAKLKTVVSNTTETASILRHVTVQKPGPDGDGDKNKRFKAVDNILKQLQGSFESTMKELPDNFNVPGEVADIRTKLRDKHHVVVTGSYSSRYFEAALAAVTEMDYNYKRCVEMQKSSDWRHIDPEDVDFVLCKDPFGSIRYDDNKAKGIADIFNSMKHTSNGESGKRIDIMIVTDFAILSECKQFHDHDMLDEVVKVFDATSAEQPADLTSVCDGVNNMNSSSLQVTSNLRVLTENFLRKYSIRNRQVDTDVLTEARKKFKANKAIVLTGPKKCGKTSAAVAFASAYQSSQCLLLTEPNDVKMIDFQNVCLVIIDEFAGKYRYEKNDVYKWYSMFDHLYSAVTAGKINVVVTCERSKLAKCQAEISPHPLLEHRVDFPDRIMVVKQEATEEEDAGNVRGNNESTELHSVACVSNSITISARSSTRPHVWSVKPNVKKSIKVPSDMSDCDMFACCQLPSGEILLADYNNARLKKLDARYQVIGVCDLPGPPKDVCYIGNDEAVVSLWNTKLQFVDVAGMTLTRSVGTGHLCRGLACHGNQLYVTDDTTVYMYNTDGIKQRALYSIPRTISVLSGPYIAVSDDGSKLYTTYEDKLVTIDSSGNHLYTFTGPELRGPSGVCVDGEGHVLVCDWGLRSILQFSSDGKHKLGTVAKLSEYSAWSLCFDRVNSCVIVAGSSEYFNVLQLQ